MSLLPGGDLASQHVGRGGRWTELPPSSVRFNFTSLALSPVARQCIAREDIDPNRNAQKARRDRSITAALQLMEHPVIAAVIPNARGVAGLAAHHAPSPTPRATFACSTGQPSSWRCAGPYHERVYATRRRSLKRSGPPPDEAGTDAAVNMVAFPPADGARSNLTYLIEKGFERWQSN